MAGFCRDCFADAAEAARRCNACGSPRLVRHAQLHSLAIAHVDCDAFYAAVEKRDDPSLADKPLIIGGGKREGVAFLSVKPVGFIWGVGKASQARLQRDGFSTVADLQRADETDLMKRYGVEGRRLWRLSRGIDDRRVNPERETKSVSAETTFSEDLASYKPLKKILWSLSERVSSRLKSGGLSGVTVQL